MAFDTAWERMTVRQPMESQDREATVERILAELSDHPFAQSQPELVRQVAGFRLRLLKI